MIQLFKYNSNQKKHTNKGDNMYYLNTFFIFSILGHIIETILMPHISSGIMFGPWTPIYGIGVIFILLINKFLSKRKISKAYYPLFIFITSAVVLSIIEFIGGLLIEILFGRIFWDYSDEMLHIGKYASLKMSLIWGISALVVTYILKPLIDRYIEKIPKLITYVLAFIFTIDIILTLLHYLT